MDQPRTGGGGRPPRDTAVTIARVLGGFGKSLIAAGVIILLFAAYQLWGTGLQERRSQGDLSSAFTSTLAQVSAADLSRLVTTTTTAAATPAPGPTTTTTAPTIPKELLDLLYPAEGEPVALLRIPKIGVEKVVVEGTGTEDLKRGPGRYSETPLPGQRGNAAIAGHRTTYGAPFFDLDLLELGDEIRVTTVLGEVVYRVAGTQIVDPTEVSVVGDFGDNRITLTACHPKYSAAKRIVVWGTLVGEPMPTIPRPEDRRTVALDVTTTATTAAAGSETAATATSAPASTTTVGPATTAAPTSLGPDESTEQTTDAVGAGGDPTGALVGEEADAAGLSGDPDAWPGAITWGAIAAAIAAAAWYAGRAWERRSASRRFRRLSAYLLASPLFLVALYYCFTFVDRLLPAI